MTRGRAATPDPFDLSVVSRSDEIFDALSCRNAADLAGLADDPAVRLLAALAVDVDAGAPPIPASARVACATPGSRRRGVVAFATFGAAVIMLASAGAAAAGGNDGGANANGPARHGVSERSNANLQQRTPDRPSVEAPRPLEPQPPRPVKHVSEIVVPVTAPIGDPPSGSDPGDGTGATPTPTPTPTDPGQSPTPGDGTGDGSGGGSGSGPGAPGTPHSPSPPPDEGPTSGPTSGLGDDNPTDGRTGEGRPRAPHQPGWQLPSTGHHPGEGTSGSTDPHTGLGGRPTTTPNTQPR